MRYLKLIPIEFTGQSSRNKRELSVAREIGSDIFVTAITHEGKSFLDTQDGYDVYRISTRRLGNFSWLCHLNRVLAFMEFVKIAWQIDADIISGHNYVVTLAGYIANCFKMHKAKIVYDSHEFELYQQPSRSRLDLWIIKRVEGFLIRRVDLAIMVGDKIADGVQKLYHLSTRPSVVRNIPQYWYLEPDKSARIREKFLQELGLSNGILLMYHGGIAKGRGIECAIRSLALLPEDTGLVIMGHENAAGMIDSLQMLATEKGALNRVLFYPAVPMAELKDYIAAVDVELVLQSAWCLNVLYSLPNKFFESIQACVPIICCDLPEMGAIVRQYDIGILVNENDEKSVAKAVLKLREDKMLYARLKENMNKAKKELCWEKESLKLKSAIQHMEGGGNDAT